MWVRNCIPVQEVAKLSKVSMQDDARVEDLHDLREQVDISRADYDGSNFKFEGHLLVIFLIISSCSLWNHLPRIG